MRRVKVAIPTRSHAGLDDSVSDIFGKTKTFTIVKVERGKIVGVHIINNPTTSYRYRIFIVLYGVYLVFEGLSFRAASRALEVFTVLIGSISHEGHKIVRDRSSGIFDKIEAEKLISVQEEMSNRTGVPCMLDVVGENSGALVKYIKFVADISDLPFLINGPSASVRIEAGNYVKEVGLQDRAIYNSVNYTLSEDEIKAIGKTGLKAGIIQAFNPRNPYPDGMIQILEGVPEKEGLIARALKAGIEKPLIFTPVLDVPSVGLAASGIHSAKEKFGLPTGTAPVGVVGK